LEDTDFCARTISAGYKIKFVGSSKIFHKVFSTTGRLNSLLPVYYSLRNRLYFAKKNLGLFYYWAIGYLGIVFFIKSIFPENIKNKMFITVINSFLDHLSNKMGKSNRF
jgi:GT2 family glycosyltransferase